MPQLNGMAEQLNRTLLEQVRTLGYSSGLPKSLWGEALQHATWLKNHTATHSLDGKTPFEALHGCCPNLSSLRPWSCTVLVHDASGSKLDIRTREGWWLGLDTDAQAH
jgi:transposase InsO family protein